MKASTNPSPRLVDATLREGSQSPHTVVTLADVIDVAEGLVEAGADMIEVGHPYVSPDAMRHVRTAVGLHLGVPILSHARANPRDIRAVAESRADWVGIFVGVNPLSETARLNGRGFGEILDMIASGVALARSLGLRTRFTVEDASRTDHDRLMRAFTTAANAGADRICYADSVGIAEPSQIAADFGTLRAAFPALELEGHFHNDRSLGIANALTAIDSGADWISVAINGLGERCGITDHGVLAANLAVRRQRALPRERGIALSRLSRRVERLSGQDVAKSHPLFGEYAFTHTARLHRLAVEKDQRCYEWISPDLIGRRHETLPLDSEDLAATRARA